MNMPMDRMRDALGALIRSIAESSPGVDVSTFRGTALYDTMKDRTIESVSGFTDLKKSLEEIDLVRIHYGTDQVQRLALQLVFSYFARVPSVTLEPEVLDTVCADFFAELSSPEWVTRVVTNLRHFHADTSHIRLTDGVSIIGRDSEKLAALGFRRSISDALMGDWGGFGSSSFVMVADSTLLKTPETFILTDLNTGWLKCVRATGAMRLLASSDVGIGKTFVQRAEGVNKDETARSRIYC